MKLLKEEIYVQINNKTWKVIWYGMDVSFWVMLDKMFYNEIYNQIQRQLLDQIENEIKAHSEIT